MSKLRIGSASLVLFLALLGGWQAVSLATIYPAGTVRYSGRATVLRATANIYTSVTKVLLADSGEMDSNGGTKDATVVTFDNPPPLEVHSKTAHAITSGINNVSSATAAVEKMVISVGSLQVTADVIEANSFAECHPDSGTVSVSGTATIANLAINGNPIDVSRAPNSSVTIPGVATIIVNEQSQPDVNSIVVNALHIIVPGAPGVASADIVISHAESGILTCTSLSATDSPAVSEPVPETEPTPEAEPAPESEPATECAPAAQSAPQSEPVPQSTAQSEPADQSTSQPEPTAQSTPTAQTEPVAEIAQLETTEDEGAGALGYGMLLFLAGALTWREQARKAATDA